PLLVVDDLEAHDVGQHAQGLLRTGGRDRDRAEAGDVVLGRDRRMLPRLAAGDSHLATLVADQREALALEVLEGGQAMAGERRLLVVLDAEIVEALLPPVDGLAALDAQDDLVNLAGAGAVSGDVVEGEE